MGLAQINLPPPRLALIGLAVMALAAAPASAQTRYKDGEFTGQPMDTEWGPVQVKAIIRGGALVDVQYLQFPYHRMRSEEISNYALPMLKAEAIRIQGARVHIISGATMTAEGFRDSLTSALALAWGAPGI